MDVFKFLISQVDAAIQIKNIKKEQLNEETDFQIPEIELH